MGNDVTKIPYRVPSAEVGTNALIRPPVCIADSCNPGGYASGTRVPCTSDRECAGGTGMTCQAHACWIKPKPGTGTACSSDADCRVLNDNNSGVGVTKCLLDGAGANGVCFF